MREAIDRYHPKGGIGDTETFLSPPMTQTIHLAHIVLLIALDESDLVPPGRLVKSLLPLSRFI